LYRKWGRATRAGRVLSRRGTLLVPSCRPCVARGHRGQPPSPVVHPGFAVSQRPLRRRWGFCTTRSLLARVIGVSEPHVVQFPPFGGGEAAVRGGAAPKVQIHWVKTAKNRHFRRNESALWRNRWVRVCRLIDTALRGVMLAEVRPAGPSYWQCQPFHAQLKPIGGMVGSPPRTPPIG